MALFRRDEPEAAKRGTGSLPPAKPARPESGAPTTLIAAGSRFQGTVGGSADVLLEGLLEGRADVEGTFVVGAHGRMQGDVKARVVQVAGSVLGNIEAGERVELAATGRIEGDVVAPRVAIAEGGYCQGRIEMTRARAAAGGPGETNEPARAKVASGTVLHQTALEGVGPEG
jgi:cytoskeletal protein CcmA (bactofilin family)